MTNEFVDANANDLVRLACLEMDHHFKPGFTLEAFDRVRAYLWRIWWLRLVRLLPGHSPYPGPQVTLYAASSSSETPSA